MALKQQCRRAVRQLTGQRSIPPYTYSIGHSFDPDAMHGVKLTPRQWAVIRHVLIAAGEQDSDVRRRGKPVVWALGQNLEYWDYDSDADEHLLVAPEYVLLTGKTLADYLEGRVTFPDAAALDEWYIDLGAPVTTEYVDRTLSRLGDQTAVVHTGGTESTAEKPVSQPSSFSSPQRAPTDS